MAKKLTPAQIDERNESPATRKSEAAAAKKAKPKKGKKVSRGANKRGGRRGGY